MSVGHNYNKRSSRSQVYQYHFTEISYDYGLLCNMFTNENGCVHQMDQMILELQDQLQIETIRLAKEVCTPRQIEVLLLRFDGYTQCEMAKILDCNQSSITKSIRGNKSYKDLDEKGKPKSYGGAIKKIRKAADKDPVIQEILRKIKDLS